MSELYELGLRNARCNGCENERLRFELQDAYLMLMGSHFKNVYEKGAEPVKGQGEPHEHNGEPIQFRAGFMSIGHSDECYHWKPPKDRIQEGSATPY